MSGIILTYISDLHNPANEQEVQRILENTLAQDLVAEDDIKPRFQALERLKEMGESKIYKRAIHDLKEAYDIG